MIDKYIKINFYIAVVFCLIVFVFLFVIWQDKDNQGLNFGSVKNTNVLTNQIITLSISSSNTIDINQKQTIEQKQQIKKEDIKKHFKKQKVKPQSKGNAYFKEEKEEKQSLKTQETKQVKDAKDEKDTPASQAQTYSQAKKGDIDNDRSFYDGVSYGTQIKQTYQSKVRTIIAKHKHYPKKAILKKQTGFVKVAFKIDSSGKIYDVKIITPSSIEVFNKESVEIFDRIKSFPPPPKELLSGGFYELMLPIEFNLIKWFKNYG